MLERIAILLSLLLLSTPAMAKDSTTSNMMKQIEHLQKKHEVLATNIANANTPKYKAKDVAAPNILSAKKRKVTSPRVKLKSTHRHHIKPRRLSSSDKHHVIEDKSGEMKPNKNNVDLAKQVSKIAANSDDVSVALKNYRSSFDLISSAADQGGHR